MNQTTSKTITSLALGTVLFGFLGFLSDNLKSAIQNLY
jgi:hypothetical protein